VFDAVEVHSEVVSSGAYENPDFAVRRFVT
jgi:hypothetical protein